MYESNFICHRVLFTTIQECVLVLQKADYLLSIQCHANLILNFTNFNSCDMLSNVSNFQINFYVNTFYGNRTNKSF